MIETTQPRKQNNIIWVILAVVLVVLCCCLVLGVVGAVVLVRSGGQWTFDFSLPGVRPTPTATIPSGKITIEPFNPATAKYPTLQQLVLGWEASTEPTTQTWKINVRSKQPVVVLLGWCTDTKETLEQNFEHIRYSITVDGEAVDVYSLYRLEETIDDGVCRSYAGIIREWPGESHTIVTTMEITEAINDGWDDYPAGEYTDVYEVTVIR